MAATDAQQEDAPPLTELESLQLKANQITDESLDSTRRMIRLCEDATGSGAKTAEMLSHQGEQLNRIEDGVENMNQEMKKAEKHLTGMEKFCGLCVCPWNRTQKIEDAYTKAPTSNDKNKKAKDPLRNPPAATGKSAPDSSGTYIRRINNDAREDEMEDNLHMVGGYIGNLKEMAQDFGTEIDKQNKQIDRINTKGATVDLRLDSANKRTEKLLQ